MKPVTPEQSLLAAVTASRGHFVYESGHHGDLWLELDALFVETRRMQGWAAALAERGRTCRPEFVCGPLTGGAFVAQFLAAALGAGFIFAERFAPEAGPVQYRLPASLRAMVSGRRVLLVDDAVNAGSALSGTLADLQGCGAELAGLAALLTLGEEVPHLARTQGVPFFTLVSLERGMWRPEECPLCQAEVPLVNPSTRGKHPE